MKCLGLASTLAVLIASCASHVAVPAPPPPHVDAVAQDGGNQEPVGGKAAAASPAPAGADQALKQANNPLANMKALNFHDSYVHEEAGIEDTANTF
jgi:hypothetical protein